MYTIERHVMQQLKKASLVYYNKNYMMLSSQKKLHSKGIIYEMMNAT
jgi:hypothetical protein